MLMGICESFSKIWQRVEYGRGNCLTYTNHNLGGKDYHGAIENPLGGNSVEEDVGDRGHRMQCAKYET